MLNLLRKHYYLNVKGNLCTGNLQQLPPGDSMANWPIKSAH